MYEGGMEWPIYFFLNIDSIFKKTFCCCVILSADKDTIMSHRYKTAVLFYVAIF